MRSLKTALAGVALAGLMAATPALAEDEAEEEATEEEAPEKVTGDHTRFDLPMKAKELREAGLDADEVSALIDAGVEAELSPAETAYILAETAPLVEEHGPVDEYAALVAHKLRQGTRGEDLMTSLAEAHQNPPSAAGASKSKKSTRPIGRRPNLDNRKPKPTRNGKLTRPGSKPKPKPSGGGGRGSGGLTRPGGGR